MQFIRWKIAGIRWKIAGLMTIWRNLNSYINVNCVAIMENILAILQSISNYHLTQTFFYKLN